MKKIIDFLRDEDGSNAIEYGLIAALVAVTIIGTLTAVSGGLNSVFSFAAGQLTGATGS